MAMIVVLDGFALNPGDLSWDGLRKLGTVTIYDRTRQDMVVERARYADTLLTNKCRISAEALRQLTQIRYIGVLATGYDVVDVEAATAQGITVTNVPSYGTESVGQYTIALLLELCSKVGLHNGVVRAGEWSWSADWSFWRAPLVELCGKTLGIVGFGRIGRNVAGIARAMGMRIIAYDADHRATPDWAGFEWVGLDAIFTQSDVLSLHCPLVPETAGMVNAARLSRMKHNAFLINAARGGLVLDADLALALNEGWIAGAGLDVLAVEPPHLSNPLLLARNCIITPHIAWATQEARCRLLATAVDNLAAFLEGHPKNVVTVPSAVLPD